jgi:aspartate kinase
VAIVVHKYGGSSVATPDKLGRVADRIVQAAADGDRVVAVVSAMGRTTDALVALKQEVSTEPHRREMDLVLSAGERISMALLAMAIGDRGRRALSLTGSQAGIITTTDHNQARIIEVRPIRVWEALEEGAIVIVGGFAGVSTDKNVTTLGRGGSDTTAISLAAALDATHCDICSDVDGVYTADPRVVTEARRIDAMAHGEVLELGLRGARVLAPEAMDYARRHGVTLRARATFGAGSGTVISDAPRPGTGIAIAVTSDAAALPVRFRPDGDAVDSLLAALDGAGLPLRDCAWTDGDTLEVVLDTRNTRDAASAVVEIAASAGVDCDVFDSFGTATVVGEGIAEQAEAWRIARVELARLGVQARRMTSSPWGLTAQLESRSLPDVVRAWHAAFPGLSRDA